MRAITSFAAALALVVTSARGGFTTGLQPEDELKAAVVLSFLRYSEWPRDAGSEAITVGVLGRPAFAQVLSRALDGKTADGRPIRVAPLADVPDSRCCQVLYIADDALPLLPRVLASAALQHALTIGESEHFLRLGGAVNLVTIDGRMSFEVDLHALERSGVRVSSRLLRFGQVRSGGRGGGA